MAVGHIGKANYAEGSLLSMAAKFAIGIDLGTTNSVLAYTSLEAEKPEVHILPVPQLVGPNAVDARTLLPSFLYIPTEEERQAGIFALPWETEAFWVVGEVARRQSAEVPHRTVGAAKSWLCYSRVDRRQPILPWNAPADVPKVSPVFASQKYLEHLAAAWRQAFPEAPIGEQLVVLTVPASFDASARELTREAAIAAGLPEDLILVEEPQAAVYAWLDRVGDRWRRLLSVGDKLLVCDVGGGTTDLTLVGVAEHEGELVLERIAVGNHLLVGGDNMDLALAHYVANMLADRHGTLDPWQAVSLWHACRSAKEFLLSEDGPESYTVTLLGRGSKVIGGTITAELRRDEVARLIVDGFFPLCSVTDRPARRRASGFRELGLPFETDTAITRHLAAFLAAHGGPATGPVRPNYVLFNGGVFKAKVLRDRTLAVLGEWFGSHQAPKPLPHQADLEHSVARGAAYYGWSKMRGGIRIRGGTPRSYYVGIETAGPAIPGVPRPLRALCVVPFGMEEGTETDVPGQEIGLVVGEPAVFRFFSSAVRKQDKPGDILDSWSPDELQETDSLETVLPADESTDEELVPVRFRPRITELGMLELWCVHPRTGRRWKLEFSVRKDAEDEPPQE